jgi:hypothetical protein
MRRDIIPKNKEKHDARLHQALELFNKFSSYETVAVEMGISLKEAYSLVGQAMRSALIDIAQSRTPDEWANAQQAEYMHHKQKLQRLMDYYERTFLDENKPPEQENLDNFLRVSATIIKLMKAMDEHLEACGKFSRHSTVTVDFSSREVQESDDFRQLMFSVQDYIRSKGLDPSDYLAFVNNKMKSVAKTEPVIDVPYTEDDTHDTAKGTQ